MDRLIINDPLNIVYPLNKDIFEDDYVVYHGTSSCYITNIEQNGWRINDQPYNIKDIVNICKVFSDINFSDEGYSVLSPFTLSSDQSHVGDKRASFTNNYWMARGFASVQGGETLHALLKAIQSFQQLILSEEIRRKQLTILNNRFNEYDKMLNMIKKDDLNYNAIKGNCTRFKNAIDKIEDLSFLIKHSEILQKLETKYTKLIEGAYGIVYAIKIQPKWFEMWPNQFQLKFRGYLDLIQKTTIKSENIIACIKFPEGIIRWRPSSGSPLPLPWKLEEFNDYVKSHQMTLSKDVYEKYSY